MKKKPHDMTDEELEAAIEAARALANKYSEALDRAEDRSQRAKEDWRALQDIQDARNLNKLWARVGGVRLEPGDELTWTTEAREWALANRDTFKWMSVKTVSNAEIYLHERWGKQFDIAFHYTNGVWADIIISRETFRVPIAIAQGMRQAWLDKQVEQS